MGLLRWIIGTVFGLALLLFMFANMEGVSVTYSPLHEAKTIPFSVLVFGFILVGFVWGAVTAWLSYGPLSTKRRQQRQHVKDLENQLKLMRKRVEEYETPAKPVEGYGYARQSVVPVSQHALMP